MKTMELICGLMAMGLLIILITGLMKYAKMERSVEYNNQRIDAIVEFMHLEEKRQTGIVYEMRDFANEPYDEYLKNRQE
jgi:hypothetical protein